TLTRDGNTTYFASERDGGFGGKDLYMSIKQSDGTWGDAENLGPAINTELDEDAPFFDSGSKTLYFSSQAHGSIGGYDVFKSNFKNDDWTPPESLGYPINSGADDIFFIFNSKQSRAYISSMRTDGIGNYDIYVINYVRPSKVILVTTFSNDLKPKDLKGIVIGSSKKDTINVSLNGKNDFIYNSEEKYKMAIPQYNDNVKVVFEFQTPESYGFFPFYQEVNYDMVVNWKGQLIGYKTTVYSAFFDIEKELKKNKNRVGNLKVEEEYSVFIKTLKPDGGKLQVYTHINYIDTTTVPLVMVNTTKNNTKTVEVLSRNPNAFKTILFDFSKSDLSVEAIADMDVVVNYLNEHKDLNMEIVGHTDSKGLNLFNSILSKKRATQIREYLILEGISGKRLKALGMGESQPVAPNENADGTDNPDGRKQNRRVEFVTIFAK
nr:OmpA family protein [Bacteroidota bacterium]